MSIAIECPLCGHKGNIPDKFDGKQVKCPSCCNLFFANPVPGSPAMAKTGGSQAGTMKIAPTGGSQAGTMKNPAAGSQAGSAKSPTGGSQFGTMKSPTAGSQAGVAKKPGSSQGTVKKPAANQGTVKKQNRPARNAASSPWESLSYEDDTGETAGTTYRKRRRRSGFKSLFVLVFLTGFLGTIGGGGFFVYHQVVTKGRTLPEMWADIVAYMPKRHAPPTEEEVDTPETKTGDENKAKNDDPPEPVTPPDLKVDASKGPARIRDVNVHVAGLAYAVPRGQDIDTKDKFFMVVLRVENKSTKVVDFQGWGNQELINDKHAPVLTDSAGQTFKRKTFGPGQLVDGQVLAESIKPGESSTDKIVFEVPPVGTPSLNLELSAENFGGRPEDKFTLILTTTMLAKSGLPRPQIQPKLEPKDEEIHEPAVVAMYRAKLRAATTDIDRKIAIDVLAELGPVAFFATPDLIPILEKGKDNLRVAAAECIGQFGSRGKAAIPALIGRLKTDDFPRVRAECATALGKMGAESAKEVAPAIGEALVKEKDETVLAALKAALARLEKAMAKGDG